MNNSDKKTNKLVSSIKYVFRNELIGYLFSFAKITVYSEVIFVDFVLFISKYHDNIFTKYVLNYFYSQKYFPYFFEYISYSITILCALNTHFFKYVLVIKSPFLTI